MKKTLVITLLVASLAAAGTVNVLIYAEGHEGSWSRMISNLQLDDRIGEVAYHDGRRGSLTVEELASWDTVIVGFGPTTSNYFYKPVITGDRLAEYVDGGGAVILTGGALVSHPRLARPGFAGAIIDPPYAPLERSDVFVDEFLTTEWFKEEHPIFSGIDPILNQVLGYNVEIAAGALILAYYDGCEPYGNVPELAVNKDKNVISLNLDLYGVANGMDCGDVWGLVANIVCWLVDQESGVAE